MKTSTHSNARKGQAKANAKRHVIASKNAASTNDGVPPKPYTEYNIYFRIERAYLLQVEHGVMDAELIDKLDPFHRDPLEHPRPSRYQDVKLPPYWYSASMSVNSRRNRRHRKREGGIDLKTLSRTISERWRTAEPEVVSFAKRLAQAELEKYNQEMDMIVARKAGKTKKTIGVLPTTHDEIRKTEGPIPREEQTRPSQTLVHPKFIGTASLVPSPPLPPHSVFGSNGPVLCGLINEPPQVPPNSFFNQSNSRRHNNVKPQRETANS